MNIQEPEQVIDILFRISTHEDLRIHIYRMINTAFSRDQWQAPTPAGFFERIHLLEGMISIAHFIHDASELGLYLIPYIPPPKSNGDFDPSTDFLMRDIPQMLTLHEMSAPKLILKKFFAFAGLNEWAQILKDLSRYALSHEDYRDSGKPYTSLQLFTHLSKLTDSMYILHRVQAYK